MQRPREVALQRIIEATAVARIRRACRSKTTTPAEVHNDFPGDLVDFYRGPRSKDSEEWHGPAQVTRNVPERGQVLVCWQNEELAVKYSDARRFMDFVGLLSAMHVAHPAGNTANMVQRCLASLPADLLVTAGHVKQSGCWAASSEAQGHRQITLAIDFATRNLFQVAGVFAVRLGRGGRRLPACREAEHSEVVVCWKATMDESTIHQLTGAPSV